jgi:hypothetical protein
MSQASFQKRQREKARQEKAAAKLARKEERRSGAAEEPKPVTDADQASVLAQLAELHERFEAGTIEFADFAEAKDELTARLDVG